MKCFLDMDGVLSDFVGGACKAHNRTCYDQPNHIGEFQVEKLWGISAEEFWKPTNNYEFWFNLNKTKEADGIVELAYKLFDPWNVCVLTSPSLHRDCVPAKRDWLKKNYPGLERNLICAYSKGFIAGPNKVLVDDRDRNIDAFKEGGGMGVLVPRLWNRDYDLNHRTLEVVTERLTMCKEGYKNYKGEAV